MATVDLQRQPSPKMVTRALEEYGKDPDQLRYQPFAMLIAQGQPAYKAFQAICLGSKKESASKQASVLLAHPRVREWIALHAIGARNLVQSLVPSAVQKMGELTECDSLTVSQKAAADIQDRGGLPKSQELAISSHQVVHAIYQRHAGTVADAALEPGSQRLFGAGRSSRSDGERASWASLSPAAAPPILAELVEDPEE